jgi:hypothetical protein
MFRVECVAATVLIAPIFMPLLTELASMENGVCYRHGAPNGAVRTSQRPIQASASLKRKQRRVSNPLPLYAKPFKVGQNKGLALRARLLGANAPFPIRLRLVHATGLRWGGAGCLVVRTPFGTKLRSDAFHD